MTPPAQTLYEVLGVTPSATADEIRSAYRRAARQTHPDHGGSSERFHQVSEAYQVLSNAEQRAAYDLRLGRAGTAGKPAGASPLRTAPPGRPPGSGRPAAHPDFGRPPVFEPDFSPQRPPVIPLAQLGRQVTGQPERPGLFKRLGSSAGSRFDAENLTIGLLSESLLPDYPAGRLVNNLRIPDSGPRGGTLEIGHVLLGGYRMAVIDSLMSSPGGYYWDGTSLRHRGHTVGSLRLADAVRTLQDRFPELNVCGRLVLHSPNRNPFEPIIDSPPNLPDSAPMDVVNPGTLARDLRRFFSTGPGPNTVLLPVLGALIDASAQ
ncbi:DnaJ domain-containing protein [Arthrobacter sp. Sa2BUA2]|uniref:DnaJ domain-containing protein n=1 Tax=Arthrobacter pullicola TaxID=2762224 RepID=A0ABR8YIW3_9MICC|nr:J domain-containing protein [Arthrobacter pullicola]MBD8044177.1 DnaJ domain-containing protein [Arthrobacter pullicola]